MLHCGSCTAQRFYAALQQRAAMQHVAMQHCAMQQSILCGATWLTVSRGTWQTLCCNATSIYLIIVSICEHCEQKYAIVCILT